MFNFLSNCQLLSKAAAAFYIPTGDVQGLRFLHIVTKACYRLSLLLGHSS